jgi:hypothetical protein
MSLSLSHIIKCKIFNQIVMIATAPNFLNMSPLYGTGKKHSTVMLCELHAIASASTVTSTSIIFTYIKAVRFYWFYNHTCTIYGCLNNSGVHFFYLFQKGSDGQF